MLVVAYYHQAKWLEADIVFAKGLKDSDKTVATLAMEFFLLGREVGGSIASENSLKRLLNYLQHHITMKRNGARQKCS